MATVPLNNIEITPGTCGGRPRIAGHRIRVQDIILWHECRGLSPDEIVSTLYPQLALADIYAALSYYHAHRDEIRRQMDEDQRFADGFSTQNPSLLQQKLRELNGRDNPLSSR